VQGWEVIDSSSTKYVAAENGRLVLHYTDYNSSTAATILVWLCGDHSLANVNGYALSARLEILNTMTSGLSPANVIMTLANNGKFVTVASQYDPVGYQWFNVVGTITTDSSIIGIGLSFSQTFTGTILVEDVKLTPP